MFEPRWGHAPSNHPFGILQGALARGVEILQETQGAGQVAQAVAMALSRSTLEETQGQILSQSPTDATRFWWHFYGS